MGLSGSVCIPVKPCFQAPAIWHKCVHMYYAFCSLFSWILLCLFLPSPFQTVLGDKTSKGQGTNIKKKRFSCVYLNLCRCICPARPGHQMSWSQAVVTHKTPGRTASALNSESPMSSVLRLQSLYIVQYLPWWQCACKHDFMKCFDNSLNVWDFLSQAYSTSSSLQG